jgi:bacteriocin biosynthesis cyclodehydratase domain-containing protein
MATSTSFLCGNPENGSEDSVINPLVEWTRVGQDKLLLRMPDGEQITFDQKAREVECVLECLRSRLPSDARGRTLPMYEPVVALLRERGLLVARSVTESRDWLQHYLAFVRAKAAPATGYAARSCVLFGSGWIYERVASAIRHTSLDRQSAPDDGDSATLIVVASDWESHELFRRENEGAVRRGQRATFIGRMDARILTGPLVVPGQGACYECYYRKLALNAPFRAEFDAYSALCSERHDQPGRTSSLACGLVEYIVARHILAAANELNDVVFPGVVELYNCVTMERATRNVLRLPRCGVCGSRVSKRERSIREL